MNHLSFDTVPRLSYNLKIQQEANHGKNIYNKSSD
jgi:hypothetical protein